jgi:GntR family transcriptional regulator, transcriptional repressor for pyruvate dehydrogenase complex
MQSNGRDVSPRLHQVVAEQIQELIVAGVWGGGSQLPAERVLCARLGVSRTVIRESLKHLSARGIVKEIPRKGTFVSGSLSEPLKDLLDLCVSRQGASGRVNLHEVRSLLEVEIAGLAAERATPEDISELERINAVLEEMNLHAGPWTEERLRSYNGLEFQFHVHLSRCTKNELFVVLLSALFGAFTKSWSDIHCQPDTRKHGVDLHKGILAAIRSGDPRGARRATRNNLKAFLKASKEL